MLYRYLEVNADLRTLLGHPKETNTLQQVRDILTELEKRYSLTRTKATTDTFHHNFSSSSSTTSWYRRHRAANANIRSRGERVSRMDGTQEDGQGQSTTVEDRKAAIRERILKMKKERRNLRDVVKNDDGAALGTCNRSKIGSNMS